MADWSFAAPVGNASRSPAPAPRRLARVSAAPLPPPCALPLSRSHACRPYETRRVTEPNNDGPLDQHRHGRRGEDTVGTNTRLLPGTSSATRSQALRPKPRRQNFLRASAVKISQHPAHRPLRPIGAVRPGTDRHPQVPEQPRLAALHRLQRVDDAVAHVDPRPLDPRRDPPRPPAQPERPRQLARQLRDLCEAPRPIEGRKMARLGSSQRRPRQPFTPLR